MSGGEVKGWKVWKGGQGKMDGPEDGESQAGGSSPSPTCWPNSHRPGGVVECGHCTLGLLHHHRHHHQGHQPPQGTAPGAVWHGLAGLAAVVVVVVEAVGWDA